MPINTDELDMSQPLAGQEIKSTEPLSNPVIPKDRLKSIAEKFRAASQGITAQPPSTEVKAKPADKATLVTEGAGATQVAGRTHGKPIIEPEKTEEVTEEPAATEPPSMEAAALVSPRARDHFKKLEAARDSYKKRAEEAEQRAKEREERLAQLEADRAKIQNVVPEEIETLKTAAQRAAALEEENKKLASKVETLDFQRSDRFQNWWNSEKENVKLAQRYVAPEHREKLAKLMELSPEERGPELSKILENVDESSKFALAGYIANYEKAKLKRDEAIAEGSTNLQRLREQEKIERAQQAQAMAKRRDQITQAALARADQFDAFKPIDGDEEHNAEIPVRKDFVRAAIAGQLDEDVAISLPGWAFEGMHLKNHVVPKLQAEIEKRDALIKQLQSSGPPTGGTTTTTTAPATKPGAQGKFLEKVRQAWRGEISG